MSHAHEEEDPCLSDNSEDEDSRKPNDPKIGIAPDEFDPEADYLDFTSERLDDIGDLRCCTRLEELVLRCNSIRNVNLPKVTCLTTLKRLDLYENRLTPLHLARNALKPRLPVPDTRADVTIIPIPTGAGAGAGAGAGDAEEAAAEPTKAELAAAAAATAAADAEEAARLLEDSSPLPADPFSALTQLEELDLSFNELRFTDGLRGLSSLQRLYLIENKITKIGDLSHLKETLVLLELGSNRIRCMQNLNALSNLTELYLGRNKIRKIEGISELKNLRILHLQANRITEVGDGLAGLEDCLEELYLGHNGLTRMEGFAHLRKLRVLDMAGNFIEQIEGVSADTVPELEDLWLNNNKIADLSALPALATLPKLDTLYLEQNPVSAGDYATHCAQYRAPVAAALPRLVQLDAEEVERG